MAIARYGVIVTELKGKQGGSVFQAGNTTTILRNLGYRKGTASNARNLANINLGGLATVWRTLSDAQRNVWNTNVAEWPFIDKFGATYTGTGYQFYLAYNNSRLSMGLAIVAAPVAPVSPTAMGAFTLVFSLSTGFAITFVNPGVAGDFVQVFTSPPVSPGRNSNNPRLKLMNTYDMDGTPALLFDTEYDAIYGVPQLGRRIVVRTVQRRSDWPYGYAIQQSSSLVVA